MAQHDARNARIIGWLLMGMAMSLLLTSIFSSVIEPSVAVPISSMFLVIAIAVFARANGSTQGDETKSVDESETR